VCREPAGSGPERSSIPAAEVLEDLAQTLRSQVWVTFSLESSALLAVRGTQIAGTEPADELDARFSSADARPTAWREAHIRLSQAEVFWLSTVRPDGRPHVTPLLAVWHDDTLYFCTGPEERKARNLEQNPNCLLTTGHSGLEDGLDLVVEGIAAPVNDEAELRRVADSYESKYGRISRHPKGPGSDSAMQSEAAACCYFESPPQLPSALAGAHSSARLAGASRHWRSSS
jgi:nitroimidazol reductase NimA-like FMN-containing flavoprotein (pyridoxamine 5'-phosphate oxidase superfamily)